MKNNIEYWLITGLMCVFIALGAVIDVLKTDDAINFMKLLGYPEYLIRFLGVMKILGVVTVLIPKYPKLKEWAYAGLTFDTLGALYSHIANGDSLDLWLPALIGLILVLLSYVYYTKRNDKNIEPDGN